MLTSFAHTRRCLPTMVTVVRASPTDPVPQFDLPSGMSPDNASVPLQHLWPGHLCILGL